MVWKTKQLLKQFTSKRRHLTLEQLEDRCLFAVSTFASAAETSPPPLEMHSEAPPNLTHTWAPTWVSAGSDTTVNLGDSLQIEGDYITNMTEGLTIAWSIVSGPGTVTIGNSNAMITTAGFSAAGVYELEFTVSNTFASASDRVSITVEPTTFLPDGIVLYRGDEMQFSGDNDHVVIDHSDDLLLNEGTVAFWFKAENNSTLQGLFSKDSSSYDTGGHLTFYLEDDGTVSARIQSTSSSYTLATDNAITVNTWHHVALSFGADGLKLFLDGELEQSGTYAGGLGTTSGGLGNFEPIVLGADSSRSGNLQAGPVESPILGGAIDDLIIVDHGLTSQELAALVSGNHTGPARPVAVNTTESVFQEGTLNSAVSATDSDGDSLTFAIVSQVSHGTLNLSADGTYAYLPNAGYVGTDTFSFKANDGTNDSNIATVTISVLATNGEEMLTTNNPLGVSEGGSATITAALLKTTDIDNTPSQLVYTITAGPTNGTVLRNGVATTTFTQADIDSNAVTYVHDGSESTSDGFTFSVDDGHGASTTGTFDILVTAVNDEQSLTTNNPLSVQVGATAAISAAMLVTTDPDNTPTDLIYTITNSPINGEVLRSGAVSTTFTQADIDAGLVSYQHNGSQTSSDSFSFLVDDGQALSTSGTFNISVGQTTSEPTLPATFDTTYNPPVGGTLWTVEAGDDLQAVLDAAQPGDIVELEAGATFVGHFYVKPKTGDGWIYIRSSRHAELPPAGTRISAADAALMPKIVGTGAGANGRALDILQGASNVRFVGVEITSTYNSTSGTVSNLIILGHDGSDQRATSADQLPENIVFDRVYIHGNASGNIRNGILMDGRQVAVLDSYIAEIHATSESHGIVVYDGAGPYKIINNHIEAAGINILYGGADSTINELVPADIEIRGNLLTKNLAWRSGSPWQVKTVLELKNARRVLVEGNIIENSWAAAQAGDPILIKSTNQSGGAPWSVTEDVTITNNIVRHAAGGVRLSGRDSTAPYGGQTSRILIENNLFYDISKSNWGGNGQVLNLTQDYRDVHFVHNTVINTSSTTVINLAGSPGSGLVIRDNIFNKGSYGVKGDGTAEGVASLDQYAPGWIFESNAIRNVTYAHLYPADNFFPADWQNIGFIDYGNGNYRLTNDSPYANAATNGTNLGANIDAIGQATAVPLDLTDLASSVGHNSGIGGGDIADSVIVQIDKQQAMGRSATSIDPKFTLGWGINDYREPLLTHSVSNDVLASNDWYKTKIWDITQPVPASFLDVPDSTELDSWATDKAFDSLVEDNQYIGLRAKLVTLNLASSKLK